MIEVNSFKNFIIIFYSCNKMIEYWVIAIILLSIAFYIMFTDFKEDMSNLPGPHHFISNFDLATYKISGN